MNLKQIINPSEKDWQIIAIAITGYIIILRLVFSGLINLLPEEAYYWNYARHLDIGYLDHPPMVAWLIWLSTTIFGNNEFAVRLPTFFCWLTAVFFIYRFAYDVIDRKSAVRTILLFAILPIYFTIGWFMTPDAPMYAAWTGALYFFGRALLGNKSRAWYGVGIFMGLGLLSKYTIGLLALPALIFIVSDRNSRGWLIRPEPYLAILIAIILFSPDLIWNYNNHWASFFFQGPRRWSGGNHFSLQLLLGSTLVLLTPVGLAAVFRELFSKQFINDKPPVPVDEKKRVLKFIIFFTLFPLSIFILFSLHHAPKLNWTGPVWIAALPLVAWGMSSAGRRGKYIFGKIWAPTAIGLTLIYTLGFLYIYAGMPGLPPQKGMPFPVAWKEFGQQVEQIEENLEALSGKPPVIIGLDRYWISSQLSFYDDEDEKNISQNSLAAFDELNEFGGRYLIDGESLMWNRWLPEQDAIGRDVIMVSFDQNSLKNPGLSKHFKRLSGITSEPIVKHGSIVGNFHWMVGYEYNY